MAEPQVGKMSSANPVEETAETPLVCSVLSCSVEGTDIKLGITLKPEQTNIPKTLLDLISNTVKCSLTQGSLCKQKISGNCADCGRTTSQPGGQMCLEFKIDTNCNHCTGDSFKERNVASEHDKTSQDICDDHESIQNSCPEESKNALEKGNRNLWDNVEPVGKKCKCKHCGQLLVAHIWNISRHLKTHEDGYWDKYKCSICQKQFTKNSHLQMHIRTHSKSVKKFPCSTCGKYFTSVKFLRQHRRDNHTEVDADGSASSQKHRNVASVESEEQIETSTRVSSRIAARSNVKSVVTDKQNDILAGSSSHSHGTRSNVKSVVTDKQNDILAGSSLHSHGTRSNVKCVVTDKQNKILAGSSSHSHGTRSNVKCVVSEKQSGISGRLLSPRTRRDARSVETAKQNETSSKSSSRSTQSHEISAKTEEQNEKALQGSPERKPSFTKMEVETVDQNEEGVQGTPEMAQSFTENTTRMEVENVETVDQNEKDFQETPDRRQSVAGSYKRLEFVNAEYIESENVYKCKFCKQMLGVQHISRHLKTHKNGYWDRYKCKICLRQFTKNSHLQQHVKTHSKESKDKHPCSICGKFFVSVKFLKQHTEYHHENRNSPAQEVKEEIDEQTEDCPEKTKISVQTYVHQRKCPEEAEYIQSENKYKCKHCEEMFLVQNIERHLKTHEEGYWDKYKCNICQRQFTKNSHLQMHLGTHSKSAEKFPCGTCGKYFPSVKILRQHRKDNHIPWQFCVDFESESGELQNAGKDKERCLYPCPACSTNFITRTYLRKHMEEHSVSEQDFKNLYPQSRGNEVEAGAKQEVTQPVSATVMESEDTSVQNTQPERNLTSLEEHLDERNHSSGLSGNKDKSAVEDLSKSDTVAVLHEVTDSSHGEEEVKSGQDQDCVKDTKEHLKQEVDEQDLPKSDAELYKCSVCQRTFKNHISGRRHEREHSNDCEYKCDKCERSFVASCRLAAHKLTHIPKLQGRHECHICNKQFKELYELRKHIRNVHKIETVGCYKCSSYFMSVELLLEHSCKQGYVCNVCTAQIPNEMARREHMKNHNRLSCSVCEKIFSTERLLNNHFLTHQEDSRSVCNICGKRITKKYMETHMKMHANIRDTMCELCGATFIHGSDLVKHQRTVHSDKPYLCPNCGKGCWSETSLNKHLDTVCTRVLDRQKCEICGKIVSSSARLEKHMLVHSEKKSHMCDICGKCFATENARKTHLKIHENFRPHQCDICGKKFRNVWHLRNHRKIHTGEGLLQCPDCLDWFVDPCYLNNMHKKKYCKARKVQHCKLCQREFANMKILQSHLEYHSGERLFECTKCGMAFAKQPNLLDHYKRHMETVRVWCQICNKGFTRATALRKHEQLHKKAGVALSRCTLSSELKPKEVPSEVIITEQQELDQATVVISEDVTEQDIQILQDAIKQEPQVLDLNELVSSVEKRLMAPPVLISSTLPGEEPVDLATLQLSSGQDITVSRGVSLVTNEELIIVTMAEQPV